MAEKNLASAKQIAFQLLKFRSRSRQEIVERLRRKGFPEEIITQTLDFLARLKYIDDTQFAVSWAQSRLAKPLGLRRILFELEQKGVNKEVIEETLSKIKSSGYRETEVIDRMAKEKFKKIKSPDKYQAKSRVYGFLMRRGFSPEAVKEAVDNL